MLELTSVDIKKAPVAVAIIPVCSDKLIHEDPTIVALLKKAKSADNFKGEKDEVITFFNPENTKFKKVLFIGLGEHKDVNAEGLRVMAGKAVSEAIKAKNNEIIFAVPDTIKMKMEPVTVIEVMMEGAFLGNHLFDQYKKEKKNTPLKKISFNVTPDLRKKYAGLTSKTETICQGTLLAREWVSTPSNDKTPVRFAAMIKKQMLKAKIKTTVFTEKQLIRKKMGALLSVAAGSKNSPRMVVMEYNHPKAKKKVVLVGKGVTFDSGGLNLKVGGSIDGMKMDMAGAAAVAGTMAVISKLSPKVNVIGITPLVENMPSGEATRPGDIVKTYDGKTVEINNTDAEGRLILVDAMSYANKTYKPDIMIDLATLTGACVVALGEKIAGVFSNNDTLSEKIVAAGNKTHERCWRMPLPDDYKELMKSDFADISNLSSSRWGGAITAALFLKAFVGDTGWAHIDIAGPAYALKRTPYCGAGGTGFGVRMLCNLLETI
ncbi:MAG: leucyl aminopeptidase [Desulfobacterales bacterium]|nr:leucyl aminopeptidase [Desulfobacterales bacterium]